jgi:deazaflavin-dependent oxidoreductase (nitroreductase family)
MTDDGARTAEPDAAAVAALRRASAVEMVTTGRRTGRTHRVPVWFAYRDGDVYFLAHAREHGRGTDWYRNLMAAGAAVIVAGGHRVPITPRAFACGVDAHRATVALFEAKYGAGAVRTWYDPALRIPVRAAVGRPGR